MDVTVIFTTQLKAALGKSEQVLSLPTNAMVRTALDALAEQHPTEFTTLVLSGGELLPSILLSVNDQQVDELAQLQDGDVLTLLSAISGG